MRDSSFSIMDMSAQNSSPLLATPGTYTKDKFIRFPWKRSLRMRLFYNRRFRRILFGTLIFVIFIFCLVFVVVPIVFRYSYSLQRSLLFLNFVNNQTNLKIPSKHGVEGARNLYVESEDGIRLGVWHILPKSRIVEVKVQSALSSVALDVLYNNQLNSGDPIFIYLHGNAGNRAAKHRVELYKLLQNNNYHVIAFDYRSYGDSSPVPPDERGVVNDAKAIFKWVKSISPKSKVFIWGHSLGTGVSSHTLYELESKGSGVSGLILEAPFTNLQDEIRDYPMSQLFRPLPWFDFFFVDPTYENNLTFSSDIYLMHVTAPLLILHAEDDKVVPFHLGKTLYEKVKQRRNNSDTVTFVSFQKDLKLGHQYIFLDRSLPQIISDFVKKYLGA